MKEHKTSVDMFFYGTLRATEVRQAVLGKDLPATQLFFAQLSGFEVRRVAGAGYPMLVSGKHEDAIVDGVMACGLDTDSLNRLDRFEGPDYQRCAITVICDGHSHIAQTYMPLNAVQAAEKWDFDKWYSSGLKAFMRDEFNLLGVRRPQI